MEARYTAQDVADRYQVKLITVYDWIRRGKLKAMRIGKKYFITPEAIAKFEADAQAG